MNVTVRRGRVSAQITSPTPAVSNLIRSVVPATARTYDPHSGVWSIFASQIDRLIAALREHGFEVVEDGAPA